MYGIAARAASQAWLGMSGQGIGVRVVPSLIPGEPSLLMVSVSNEARKERYSSEKISGLVTHNIFKQTTLIFFFLVPMLHVRFFVKVFTEVCCTEILYIINLELNFAHNFSFKLHFLMVITHVYQVP